MEAKKTLARDVVAFYHGAEEAPAAQQRWVDRFSKKQDPESIPEVLIPADAATNEMGLLKLLVAVDTFSGSASWAAICPRWSRT